MVGLKRRLTLKNGVSICMGLILGVSMFISPTGVIRNIHSPGLALSAWIICGLLSVVDGLVFAEMGTTFKRSGFMYVYLEEYIGPFPAFLYLWEYYMFHRAASNAIKCLAFAVYILEPMFIGCQPPALAVKIIAILLAAAITYINMTNMKVTARLQMLFVMGVIVSFLFIIGVAIYHVMTGGAIHISAHSMFDNINPHIGEVVIGFYSAIYAYGGWEALNFMVTEVHNPERVLPLSIGISLGAAILVFFTINLAYTMVLGAEGMINANGVAASMLQKVFLSTGPKFSAAMVIFSTCGSFNSGTLVASRLGYAAAKRSHFPRILALVNQEAFTPVTSLLFQLFMIVICCLIGDMYVILNNVIFAKYCFKFLTIVGYIRHRLRYPLLQRPFKVPLCLSMALLVIYTGLLVIPLITKPLSCAGALAVCFFTASPYYLLFIKKPCKMTTLSKFSAPANDFEEGCRNSEQVRAYISEK